MITDDSFKMYSKELTKLPQMNAKREKQIMALMLDPTTTDETKKQLKDEIVTGYLRYVIKEANRFSFAGVDMVDLISEGNYGLMVAIDKFDWSSGNKFTTYCYHWIRQSILNCIYENSKTIRLPINISQELHRQIKQVNDGQLDDMDDDLVNLPNTIDLFTKIGGDDDGSTLIDVVQDDNALIPDRDFSNKNIVETMFSRLTERERKVLTMYYGLDGEDLDIKEIAVKLNIHKESVRLTKIAAEEKLKNLFLQV